MFKHINEIKKANKEAGYHYWEPSTVRFFQGKTLPKVYGGRCQPGRYSRRRAASCRPVRR